MIIVEKFHSLQGEGPNLSPAFFVRLGGCNLRCVGFGCKRQLGNQVFTGCDTIQAAYPQFKSTWIDVSVDDIFNEMISKPISQLVITGGEPTLQMRKIDTELFELIKRTHDLGIEINVETNGTKKVHPEIRKLVNFSVSVKLSNSGEPKVKRVVPESLKQFDKRDYFKFVHDGKPETTQEILDIVKDYDVPVYLMPLGNTRVDQIANTAKVAEECIKYNWRFSPRVHIIAWGGKDGV